MKKMLRVLLLMTLVFSGLVIGSSTSTAVTSPNAALKTYAPPEGYEDYFSEEGSYTPPSADLKIKPIYCPALKTGQMPTIDFFHWALPEKGIYAHKGDGTPLLLVGLGGGTAEGNWNKPGVYTVVAVLSDNESEQITTILPVIIEAHDGDGYMGY